MFFFHLYVGQDNSTEQYDSNDTFPLLIAQH